MLYSGRGLVIDKEGSMIGLQLGYIQGLISQQVDSLEQMKQYVDKLNSIDGATDKADKSAYKRDMKILKQQVDYYADQQFRYYMQFALRPSIPVYKRILRIKESVTLIPGDYYMLCFESASSKGTMQQRLGSRRIFKENEICCVPIGNRFSTPVCRESYATYWGINSDRLVILISKTPRGQFVYDAILNALRNYRLGVVSKLCGRPGLQLLFIDSVVRR